MGDLNHGCAASKSTITVCSNMILKSEEYEECFQHLAESAPNRFGAVLKAKTGSNLVLARCI